MVPPRGWSYDVKASSLTLSLLTLYAEADKSVRITPSRNDWRRPGGKALIRSEIRTEQLSNTLACVSLLLMHCLLLRKGSHINDIFLDCALLHMNLVGQLRTIL